MQDNVISIVNEQPHKATFKRGTLRMQREKDGTYGDIVPVQKRRKPTHDASAKADKSFTQRNVSAKLPPIALTRPTRRLIPDGEYRAICIGARYCWHRLYRRWSAEIYFICSGVSAGLPIVKYVSLGTNPESPELSGNSWLGKLAQELGTTDLDALLKGREFFVEVITIKHRKRNHKEAEEGIEVPDRPQAEWYSTIRSVKLAEPDKF